MCASCGLQPHRATEEAEDRAESEPEERTAQRLLGPAVLILELHAQVDHLEVPQVVAESEKVICLGGLGGGAHLVAETDERGDVRGDGLLEVTARGAEREAELLLSGDRVG